MQSRPVVDITTPVRPIAIPETPESVPSIQTRLPGQMANQTVIQVMSPRSTQESYNASYDAISLQHNLVQRACNQPYHAISAQDVPVPEEVTLREVHIREATFSNTLVSAPGQVREVVYSDTLVSAPTADGPTFPSTQIQEDVDPERRNVRRKVSNPPSTVRSSSCPDTPHRAALRQTVVQQDASIQNLRGQLNDVQQQATTAIETQRATVVAAAEQHVHDSRVQDAAEVAKAAAAMKQEYENELAMLRNNAQQERIQFQQETDAQARAMIEAKVNERVSILQSELRDAAIRAVVDSQQVVQTTAGTFNVPQSAPVSIVPGMSGLSNSNDSGSNTLVFALPEPNIYRSDTLVSAGSLASDTRVSAGVSSSNTLVSAPLEEACYVCEDPMSVTPRNQITQQEFHSLAEDRSSWLQSMDLQPSGISTHARELVFENSPCTGLEQRFPVAECTDWLRGNCKVGKNCQFSHSRKTGNSVKREVSWDRRLVKSSSDSDILMSAQQEGEHTDIPAAPTSSASSHLQEEMDKLRAALSKKDAELHYAQMQLQLKAKSAAPPSDSAQHYNLADDDDDNPCDYGYEDYGDDYCDDDYEDALESHESVQKPIAEVNTPVGPAPDSIQIPAFRGMSSNTLVSAIEKQSDNQVHNPEVSNAGGNMIPMDGSYLASLLAKDTYSKTALYPVREKIPRASSNTRVSATSPDELLAAGLVTPKTAVDARQTFERTPHRQSTSYRDPVTLVDRKINAPISNTLVYASPPMGAPHVNMEVGAISPQALLLQPKVKEADYIQFEPLPNIKDFRPWRMKFFKKIAAASGRGEAGTIWISKIEKVFSIEEFIETD